MAKPHGSSLSQARKSHHNHLNLHNDHTHSANNDDVPEPALELRQLLPELVDAVLTTQVVQTVSLIQIVNSLGEPVEVQTLYGDPLTQLVDAGGVTVDVPGVLDSLTTPLADLLPTPTPEGAAPQAEAVTPTSTPAPENETPGLEAPSNTPSPAPSFPTISRTFNSTGRELHAYRPITVCCC